MDGTGVTTLRKRQLSVRVSDPAGDSGASLMASSAPPTPAQEPFSPTSRLAKDLYIVAVLGSGKPIDLAAVRAGLLRTVARHPRFCSVESTDGGAARWVRTAVNVDDHVVVPCLDDGAVAADPERAVEDYVASLSTLPMDASRPLWEVHILNFPTSAAVAATAVFRCDHSLGDGTSMIALVLASARSSATPGALPVMPPPGRRRTGQVYARPRPPPSAGVMALAAWAWSYVVLAWNTVVDVAGFLATLLFLNDPPTPFKQQVVSHGEVVRARRLVHAGLSLDDVKYIKNTMNCTVSDVLVGVASAALSRYYFRKIGDSDTNKNICFRSLIPVNIRSVPGLQALADMMDSNKGKDVAWGVRLGFILLPLHMALHNDPLEYIRKAKKTADRKKCSLEVIFTNAVVEMTTKILGLKAAAVVFGRMLSHTTISISSMMGPIEKIELFGHPIVFIAPTTFGVPEALCLNFQSYMNTVRVILAVDDTKIQDYHILLNDFTASLKLIRDAASKISEGPNRPI